MIYNHLLVFIVAIFLFTVTSGTAAPLLPFPGALALFSALLFLYDRIAVRAYSGLGQKNTSVYFQREKQLSLLALVFYATALFVCDIHYYLLPLSLNDTFPAFTDIGGLCCFSLFLLLMWRRARPVYEQLFGREYSSAAFLLSNTRANLPIVLPWLFLSLAHDLLALLPFPGLADFLNSEWGEYASFFFFLLLLLVFFPPLVRRLWACQPFPEGSLRDHLQGFFASQRFSAKLFLWPLFEGRVLTAGVMGIVPGLRYVMITPALLEALSLDELEAVMAHEIGHVKKRHMLLYLLIISGFSILAMNVLEPFTLFILSRPGFYTLLRFTDMSVENMLTLIMVTILLVGLVLYFRFLFGYFIRNFERQADLHVFPALGSSDSIISAFEKIAVLSGNTRDQPSWHHFGIGQRVTFLQQCEADPSMIDKHNRKVRLSLLAYILVIGLVTALHGLLPPDSWQKGYEENYAEYVIEQKLEHEPNSALWLALAGDLLQHKKMENKALLAYNRGLALEPDNPQLLNNLAWLLLTSEDSNLRDPVRAQELAGRAAVLLPAPHILDTLATAYWANGFVDKAVELEKQALSVAADGQGHYLEQLRKFTETTYSQQDMEEEKSK
ncbi:MAG: M48 family metalloprotease [Thermodesulfobacteriota bacterium]